jgi:tetratricopeptide (TPR) repeat protein
MCHSKPANSPISKHSPVFTVALRAFLLLAAALPAQAQTQAQQPSSVGASEQYERCLQLTRSKPEAALEQAELWRNAGGGFPAQHCAGVALVGLKKYAEAARRLETLASAMMQGDANLRAGILDQAGQAWLLAGDAKQAVAAYQAALTLKRDDPDLLIGRAQAFAEGEQFPEAITDLTRAAALAPRRADILILRASAYRALSKLDPALQDADRALRLEPDAVPGLLERGNIRRLKEDAAGARTDWERVERLAPGTPAALAAKNNLARLDRGEPAAAKPPAAPTPKPKAKP